MKPGYVMLSDGVVQDLHRIVKDQSDALARLRSAIEYSLWDLTNGECAELCEWNGSHTQGNAAALRLVRDRLQTALALVK